MITASRADLTSVLEALADPTRQLVVEALQRGPKRAGELAATAVVSRPSMSRHLRVLLAAGLVTDERMAADARARVFRLRPESVVGLRAWLDQLQAEWDGQLQSFKRHVEKERG